MTNRIVITAATVLVAALTACSGGSATPPTPSTVPGGRGLDLTLDWAWASPGGFSPGLPAGMGDDAAATWSHQLLVVFDGAGSPRWQAQRLGLLEVAPAVTPTLVLSGTDEGVIAYDRTTGRVRWESTLGEKPASPVVADGTAIVTTWDGSMVALGAGDGRVAWRAKLGAASGGPAALSGRVAVATFDDGRVAGATAIDLETGRSRWTVPLPPGGVSAPAVTTTGVVVVVAGDVAAHGLSVDDGAERWRTPLDGSGSPEVPPVALADGGVVVGHRLGGMAMLDGGNG
ncbi:MAG: PQQ-binding-like beta-propeller repeat protein, partial [Acidimicrobiales bacterium]